MYGALIGTTGADIITSSAQVTDDFASTLGNSPLTMILGGLIAGLVVALIIQKIL